MARVDSEIFLNHCFEVIILPEEKNPANPAEQILALSSVTPIRSLRNQDNVNVFDTIELKRAVSHDTYLFDWRRNWHDGIKDYRTLIIRPLRETGEPLTWQWRLTKCWPHCWEGPALDAMQADVMQERLALYYEKLEWLRT